MRRILLAFAPMFILSCGGGGSDKPTQPVNFTPAIVLSTGIAAFSGTSGGANPAAQNIGISNGGTGTLTGITAGAVVYGAGQPTGWLTATVSGATAPTTLTLTPTAGTLLVGTYTASVAVTSTASGVTNSPQTVSASFTVTAGAATRLVYTAQPTVTTGGTINAPVSVAVQDAAGNIVTSATTSIAISLGTNISGAALGGTTTVAAVAGIATFSNLSVNKSGTGYTLVAAATGLTSATSNAFTATVAAAIATQLAFSAQPSNAAVGATMAPPLQVTVLDASGSAVTTATNSVTIAIATNPGNSTLGGTATAAAVNGVATFTNLSLNSVGSGYTFTASSAGLTSATSNPFNITVAATAVTLTAGQSAAFLTSSNFNAALSVQGGSQYLVTIVNTNPTYQQSESFSLTGSFGVSALAQRGPVVQSPAPVRAVPPPAHAIAKLPRQDAARRAREQNHVAQLAANRRLFARAGNPRAAWASARSRGAVTPSISASVNQTVGSVTKLYVGNSIDGGCSSVDSIGARTVAVGQHVLVFADTDLTRWPQQYRPDSSFYASFASEFDQITWPHLIANIGNPLAYDASLSGTGKVSIVLTPVLNNLTGGSSSDGIVVAYVSLCDFYPNHSASIGNGFSNQTEMLYSLVPAANAISSITDWEDELRATVAHEAKHIVSFTDRIINNSPELEEVWLEEGLANISSEIWMRNFNQATWLGHATFAQTIACEVDLASSNFPCDAADNKPWGLYFSHLPFFFDYLLGESLLNNEGLGLDSPSDYGAGWAFARWATDQYAAGSEPTFVKSLINEPTLTGTANLSQHTGQTAPSLLAYWNVASAIYNTPTFTAGDARITYPSFNFADIFGGGQIGWTCGGVKCGFFTDNGFPPYPVQTVSLSSAIPFSSVVNGVPGTSAAYFLFTASGTGIETLRLLAPTGGALGVGSGFRVVLLRVQ